MATTVIATNEAHSTPTSERKPKQRSRSNATLITTGGSNVSIITVGNITATHLLVLGLLQQKVYPASQYYWWCKAQGVKTRKYKLLAAKRPERARALVSSSEYLAIARKMRALHRLLSTPSNLERNISALSLKHSVHTSGLFESMSRALRTMFDLEHPSIDAHLEGDPFDVEEDRAEDNPSCALVRAPLSAGQLYVETKEHILFISIYTTRVLDPKNHARTKFQLKSAASLADERLHDVLFAVRRVAEEAALNATSAKEEAHEQVGHAES